MKHKTIAALTGLAVVAGSTAAAAAGQTPQPAHTQAAFETYQATAQAVTYDQKEVPVGAEATVLAVPTRAGTTSVVVLVQGLRPNETYGVHAHQNACGATAAAAGPHYQNDVDPVQPSVDPAYANSRNEIWLDLTTDVHGDAAQTTTVNWTFADRHANSIVLHADHTSTHAGHAGTAGTRLACVNVAF